MSTPEQDVYDALTGYAPLVSAVSSRIYVDVRSQDSATPAVVLFRTAVEPIVSLSGAILGNEITFAVVSFAETRTEAEEISALCRTALTVSPFVHAPSSGFDYDEDVDLHISPVFVIHQM